MSAKVAQLLVDNIDGDHIIDQTKDVISNLRIAMKNMILESEWLKHGNNLWMQFVVMTAQKYSFFAQVFPLCLDHNHMFLYKNMPLHKVE